MRLSEEEITELIFYHKQMRSLRDGDKLKCVIYWGKGYSWEEIKELLFISDGTLKTYIDRYKKGDIKGLLQLNYTGSNHQKLSYEEEQAILKYLVHYNVLKSSQVVDYVKRKFGVSYTSNGITILLKRLGCSYKKPKRVSCKLDKVEEKLFAYRYSLESQNLGEEDALYFADGAGFEHNAKIDYGWMRKGQSKTIKTNTGRKRLNVNGAYNIKTHEGLFLCQEENINTSSNIRMLEKIIEENPDKKRIIVIWDNAAMNKNEEIFRFIRRQNNRDGPNIELMFTPPYCPHLNLIERLWRFVKRKLFANQYYPDFAKFKKTIKVFLEHRMKGLKKELKSLMTENFEGVSVPLLL
jgi:transposase